MRTLIGTVVALVMLGGCSPDAEPSPPPTPTGPVTTSPTPADTVTSTGPTPTSATTTSATTTEPPDSTTETSSPEATGAPTLPPEATEDTEAGAEAFARYYMDVLNAVYTNPGSVDFAIYHGPGCTFCPILEEEIVGLADENLRYRLPPFSIESLEGTGLGDGRATMVARVTTTPYEVIDGEEALVTAYEPPPQLAFVMSLEHDGDRWIFTDLNVGTE